MKKKILSLVLVCAIYYLTVTAKDGSALSGTVKIRLASSDTELASIAVGEETAAYGVPSVSTGIGEVGLCSYDDAEIMPLDLLIDSGEINNKTGLDTSKKLNKSNGKYVNLYVENNGSNSVVATINGKNERTFKPGEKGHICLEVTQGFLGIDKEYTFKVVTGTNGGTVKIHYEIAQRDTQ